MASFKREEALVRHLLARLSSNDAATYDPNAAGKETGVDVAVQIADHRVVGVPVTEVDPYALRGSILAAVGYNVRLFLNWLRLLTVCLMDYRSIPPIRRTLFSAYPPPLPLESGP